MGHSGKCVALVVALVVLPASLKAAEPEETDDDARIKRAVGALVGGETSAGLAELRSLAEKGNTRVMCALGALHLRGGCGIQQNLTESARWYRKAAIKGDPQGQYGLANAYQEGWGVQQNPAKASRWYRKAADRGHLEAMVDLGWLYWAGRGVDQDFGEAMRWYRKAAESGLAQAMVNIGVLYDNGQGVEKDHVEALRWFRKAADTGHAHAMYNVGICYDFGRGVQQDCSTAAEWYLMSAEEGFSFAAHNLALLYYDGRGVQRALPTARRWFRSAQGSAPSPERAMWIWMCNSGLGDSEQAKRELNAFRSYHKPSGFAGRLLALLDGEVAETEFLDGSFTLANPAEAICLVNFCAGMKHRFEGDRKRAIKLLKSCVEFGPVDSTTRRTAKLELARLQAK